MTCRARFAFITALLLLPVTAAVSQAVDDGGVDPPAPTEAVDAGRVDLAAPAEVVDAQRAYWRERFRTARDVVSEARGRYTLAQEAYGTMRHREGDRGDKKAQVMQELTSSGVALADAEAGLKDLFEAARKAGVPPGWMRMNPGLDSPAASPN